MNTWWNNALCLSCIPNLQLIRVGMHVQVRTHTKHRRTTSKQRVSSRHQNNVISLPHWHINVIVVILWQINYNLWTKWVINSSEIIWRFRRRLCNCPSYSVSHTICTGVHGHFHTKFRTSNSHSPLAITIKPKDKPSCGRHTVQKETRKCILSRTINRNLRCLDSVVGIATGLRESPYGQIFSLLQNVQTGYGTRWASYFMGSGVLYWV